MPNATAVINLDIEGPTISRHLYGHFAEHLGRCVYGGFWVGEDSPIPNEGGIRLDVVEALVQDRVEALVQVALHPVGGQDDAQQRHVGIGPLCGGAEVSDDGPHCRTSRTIRLARQPRPCPERSPAPPTSRVPQKAR